MMYERKAFMRSPRPTTRKGALALCTALGLLGLSAPAEAKASFTNFDPQGSTNTQPWGINTKHDVAGNYYDGTTSHGFLRTADGTITTFDPAGSTNTQTGDSGCITDEDVIVGQYADVNGVFHGYERAADGTITTFDPSGSTGTVPLAINDKGQITGFYSDSNGVNHGFVSGSKGFTTFDPKGSVNTEPVGINDEGVIGGEYQDKKETWHGFVRAADGTITKVDPEGSVDTHVIESHVNSAGAMTGQYKDNSGDEHGFVRAGDGTITSFDAPRGVDGTEGYDINDDGTIAGAYQTKNSNLALERNTDGTIRSFRDPQAGKGPFYGTFPNGINSSSWIEGYYIDGSGVSHGFLRKP